MSCDYTRSKYCTKCGVEKFLCDFNHNKNKKDGHESRCRACRADDNRDLVRRFPWIKTKKHIRNRCKNPKHRSFKQYGGRIPPIKDQISVAELKKLWFRDEADRMKYPSIDRSDPDDHYRYANCFYAEGKENYSRVRRRRAQ